MSDEQFNIHTPLKRLFDTREFPSEAAGGGPLEPTDPRPAPLPRPASSLPLRLHPPSSIRSSTPNRADRFCDVVPNRSQCSPRLFGNLLVGKCAQKRFF